MESKVLIVEGEERVEDEESSNEEVKKDIFLMTYVDESFIDEASRSLSTFDSDLLKDVIDSKARNWNSSSLYQVKKFVTYSNNEKTTMFEYLCLKLYKSNKEIQNLKNKIKYLTNELTMSEKSHYRMSSKFRDLSLTNHELISENDSAQCFARNDKV